MFDFSSTVEEAVSDGGSSAKSGRKPTRLEQYYADKAAGICTAYRCRFPATDTGMCATCAAKHREATRNNSRQRRQQRREAGLCVDCPNKSETYRCLSCAIMRGEFRRGGVVTGVVESSADPRFRKHDDGRTRYHGQMRRGRQPAAQIDDQDLELAIAQLTKARDHLRIIAASAEIQAKPKYQRDAAKREALAMAEHGARFVEELLDRNGFSAGNELRHVRVSPEDNKRRGGR